MRQALILLALAACLAGCSRPGAPPPPAPPPPVASPSPSPSPSPVADLSRVKAAVQAAGGEFPGQAGVVYYDLRAGRGAYHGENRVFEAASLVKLPIMVELYRRAQAGEVDLDSEMVFEERFRAEGSGLLKSQPAGTRWKLRELARLMIAESDNTATDMLLERLGMESIETEMARLGLKHTTVRRRIFDFAAIDAGRDNLTSPVDMLVLLQGIARERLPGSKEMMEILKGQKRRDMIPAGVPAGVAVAHKTGELLGVLHDVGVVLAPDGEYILVLMGQGFPDREEGVARWAAASKAVWKARSQS